MDVYSCFFDLKSDTKDMEFVDSLNNFMGHLESQNHIESWRLLRRKLGLGPRELGEFHLLIETKDLAQLDVAFKGLASRSGTGEDLHFGINSRVTNVRFMLYRDFPDSVRETGSERF